MEMIIDKNNSEQKDKKSLKNEAQMRPPPLPVQRAIQKLGSDVSLARRRRHISQVSLAERIGASVSTIRRLEAGDLRIPIHFVARVLHVFGDIDALNRLLDTAQDDIGLTLMDEQLPKRIHSKKITSTGIMSEAGAL
jgi:ribosome-binding protein aMBF1 (putative translation factor)